jgi:hypothetical protein
VIFIGILSIRLRVSDLLARLRRRDWHETIAIANEIKLPHIPRMSKRKQAEKKTVGRPSIPEEERASLHLGCGVTKAQKKVAENFAARVGQSKSTIIKRAFGLV